MQNSKPEDQDHQKFIKIIESQLAALKDIINIQEKQLNEGLGI